MDIHVLKLIYIFMIIDSLMLHLLEGYSIKILQYKRDIFYSQDANCYRYFNSNNIEFKVTLK